jgi:carboxylesterase type B
MSTEDRIRELCARAVSESDETAVRQTVEELQSALAEYIQSLRLKTARVVDKIYARPLEP